MDQSREFLIPTSTLMKLSMELAVLIESHENMCKWLGPFEQEDGTQDYVANYYRRYFDKRFSFTLLTLALLLRTLDDRKLIEDYVKYKDPVQIELGRIRIGNGQWEDIDNFRTVLNFLIHATEIIPNQTLGRWN